MPAVESVGLDLYADADPLAFDDKNQGWPLLVLCGALGRMLQTFHDLVSDTDDGPGYSQLVDVDRCPLEFLPYLGQYVGVTVDSSLDEEVQRDQIRDEQRMKRGSVPAIIVAGQKHLTGSKSVQLIERDADAFPDDPAYGFTVITYDDQTPDPTATEADLRARTVKPGGLLLNYVTLPGQTYDELADAYATIDDVEGAYTDYDNIRDDH